MDYAEEDIPLDAESLDRLSRYVDDLYTRRTFELSDSNDDLISLGKIDIETVQSMEKLIRVLSKEDEPLAQELEDGMVQAHLRHETLSSLGKYVHVFAKTNHLSHIGGTDEEDDNSTLPGTIVLEKEHPDMLKSISNYIDSYTLATKDPQRHNIGLEKRSVRNKIADDWESDLDTETSSQIAEFQNNEDGRACRESHREKIIDNNDTATTLSDDLTAQISPETLSKIGAFIDLVAQRNKRALASKALDAEDATASIGGDASTIDEDILTQLSEDASLALNANPGLLASLEAYIDQLAKTNGLNAAKGVPDNSQTTVHDNHQQVALGENRRRDGKLSVALQNCVEPDLEAFPSFLMLDKKSIQQRPRNPSADPPATFLSVRSNDDENDYSSENNPKFRQDPETSTQQLLQTNDEETRRGENENKAVGRNAISRPNQHSLRPLFNAADAHVQPEKRGNENDCLKPSRDPEVSSDLVFDTTGEQARQMALGGDSKENLQSIEQVRTDNAAGDGRPRDRMGGPEILLKSNRTGKSMHQSCSEQSNHGAMEKGFIVDKSQNDEYLLGLAKKDPTVPENKIFLKEKHDKSSEAGSQTFGSHEQSYEVHDLTNVTANTFESPILIDPEPGPTIPVEIEEQFKNDVRTLTTLVTSLKQPTLDDETTVRVFAQFCYPLVANKEPRAASVSNIMCKADELGLPLDAADRFLNLAQLVLDERRQNIEIEAVPSDEAGSSHVPSQGTVSFSSSAPHEFHTFVSRLVEAATKSFMFMSHVEEHNDNGDIDDNQAYVDIVVNSGSGGEDGIDAIEVDLLCGALTSDYRRNDQNRWHNFATNLLMSGSVNDLDNFSSTSSDYADKPPSRTFSEQFDPTPTRKRSDRQIVQNDGLNTRLPIDDPVRSNHQIADINQNTSYHSEATFDKDIMKFWKEQLTARKKRFGYPSKTVRSIAESYSHDDNDTLSFVTASHASSFDMTEDAWIIRRSMAMYGNKQNMGWTDSRKFMMADVHPPKAIDAVHATAKFFHRGSFLKRTKIDPLTSVWKEIYADRTMAHPGYLDVHINSLYASTSCHSEQDSRDSLPWESRPVKQRFLHEQSVSFCKNWFGILVPVQKNQDIPQPICRPDSFPMPVAGEWTQDWYIKKCLAPIQSNLSGSVGPNAFDPGDFLPDEESDSESLFDKAPQCGRIRNMKLKIGEKITLVTPDLTSSLRRSRWRKKHFPRGTFPYK
ncbi:hypothetical protein FisN_14Lh073 [Fistulifera solaris]|uniref:Uncharacterized protein n=1 Tax=Fistulifera solaris TaxID=1519565 RepID=A0A1Z5J990_FISSO|nr:hypothetical protein FisN_14Lh073 [Fistulifera solaris]|eukprot:GAX10574.1 hypothetical protein FisN_14Lh073 [Fistulifera solaris]